MARCIWIIPVAIVVVACGCEKSASLPTYQTVVANIRAGSQAVGANGEVVLPATQAASVSNGKAYVTKQPGGEIMVLFPTWRGKGSNLRGYLFSSGPALNIGSSVQVNVPMPIAPGVGTREITIENLVEPGWYYVSCTLD